MVLSLSVSNAAEPFGGGSERLDPTEQVEKRWVRFFRKPSLWWDQRRNSTAKSGSWFKHVEMHEVLPLSSCPEHLQGKLRFLDFPRNDEPFRARYASHSHNCISAALIGMFSKSRNMLLAQERFDEVVDRNVWVWSSLIKGYVDNGDSLKALDLFMNMEDCEPNASTYTAVLTACKNLASDYPKEQQQWLEKGISIHKQIKDAECEADTTVANCLMELYKKCGQVDLAKEVFDNIAWKDDSSWSNMIMIHVERGENLAALDLYGTLDCEPGPLVCIAALKACGGYAKQVPKPAEGEECGDGMGHRRMVAQKGIAIHEKIVAGGFDSNVEVSCALLDMYTKCERWLVAQKEFLRMQSHGVAVWNAWMMAQIDEGQHGTAYLIWMIMEDLEDNATLAIALKAFSRLGHTDLFQKGRLIHAVFCRQGLDQRPDIRNDLIYLYARCEYRQLHKALLLVGAIEAPDRVVYETLDTALGKLNHEMIYRADRPYKDIDDGLENLAEVVARKADAAMLMERVRKARKQWQKKQQILGRKGYHISI